MLCAVFCDLMARVVQPAACVCAALCMLCSFARAIFHEFAKSPFSIQKKSNPDRLRRTRNHAFDHTSLPKVAQTPKQRAHPNKKQAKRVKHAKRSKSIQP